MSTRIRYKMNKFEVLVSPEFLAVDKIVYAEIYHDFHANIYEKGKGLPLLRLESNNMQNLKKLAKKTLKELGVIFENEIRPRFSESTNKDLIANGTTLESDLDELIKNDHAKYIKYSDVIKDDLFEEDDSQ